MARLRLFANLREAAGTSQADFPGATVQEVLDAACAAYGDGFARNMTIAKVWVNGDPAATGDKVGEQDEIALIPPVSGGTLAARATDSSGALLVVALLVALVISNNIVSTPTFIFVVVGTTLAWLWDTADVLRIRGITVNPIPLMIGATAAANGAYRWAAPGFAGGLAVAIVITLAWAVLDRSQRSTRTVSIAITLAVVASLATGSLTMIHLHSLPLVNAAIAVAASAGFVAWGVQQSGGDVGGLDPNLGMVLGAIIAGLISGLAAESLSITTMILASASGAAGLIAGRAYGSLLRTGSVVHTARAPGLLTMFDGAALGVAAFWAATWIFA
ncbi:MAG: MoaD/ThiS family protein [Actinomycetota bacterium]|nr:MoaD/ThiS family protein [Actinomycetota bacterium]